MKLHDAMKMAQPYGRGCWYDDPEIVEAIERGQRTGLVRRTSHSQVEWTDRAAKIFEWPVYR